MRSRRVRFALRGGSTAIVTRASAAAWRIRRADVRRAAALRVPRSASALPDP